MCRICMRLDLSVFILSYLILIPLHRKSLFTLIHIYTSEHWQHICMFSSQYGPVYYANI